MAKNTSTGSILKRAAFKARLIFNICHIQSYMYEAFRWLENVAHWKISL